MTRDLIFKDYRGIFLRRKTVTAASNAATLRNAVRTQVTSEALTTAAGATYTLTLTNNLIATDSFVYVTVKLGTATTGMPVVTTVTPAAGSVVIIVQNIHASAALNGTIVLDVVLVRNSPAQ